jgi:hypothetical protein
MSIEIRLSRMDRVYNPGQTVRGVVVVHGRGATLAHEGIQMTAEGSASLQLSAKSVGLFEAFYSSIKPVQLLLFQKELSPSGRIAGDAGAEFEFEIPLQPAAGEKLVESYHGVFVNLQYVISVEVRRGMLAKNLKRSIEFILEAPETKVPKPTPATFSIVPESLENVRKSALHQVPSFKVRGQLDSTTCNIAKPLTGEVIIEECSATIKSIELQLVRVETCGYQDGMAREATEIQNIQIADGPVCHGWPIPVYMIFPRLFTCPTIATRTFKVDFEVNLVILFSDGHLLTENFPLKLLRAPHGPSGAPMQQLDAAGSGGGGGGGPLGGGGGGIAEAVRSAPAIPAAHPEPPAEPDDPLASAAPAPAPAPAAPPPPEDPLGSNDPLSDPLS